VEEVLQEINGHTVRMANCCRVQGAQERWQHCLRCWIYSGVFPNPDENKANKRQPQGYLGHGWGFAWPNDCRIIYKRASARPDGKRGANVRSWSGGMRKTRVDWLDTPDFEKTTSPDAKEDLQQGHGWRHLGARPFVLHPDGVAAARSQRLKDGPLPTHYERWSRCWEIPYMRRDRIQRTKERAAG